jgi:hypothetical protein
MKDDTIKVKKVQIQEIISKLDKILETLQSRGRGKENRKP